MKDSTSGLVGFCSKCGLYSTFTNIIFNPVWIHWKQIAGQKFEE